MKSIKASHLLLPFGVIATLTLALTAFADQTQLSAEQTAAINAVLDQTMPFTTTDLPRPTQKEEPATTSVPLTIKTRATVEDLQTLEGVQYDAPNSAGLLLVFRAPSDFSTRTCGSNRIEVSDTAANSVVWPETLQRSNGQTREQEVKGMGDTTELKVEHGDCISSITVGLRLYELMGGPGAHLIGYMVDDKTLEAYHQAVGFNDPYGREELGMNQLVTHLTDTRGRQFNAPNNSYFVLPLQLRYDRYLTLERSARNQLTLDVGTQVMLPLDSTFDQAAVGTFANLTQIHAFSVQWLSTLALGIGTNIQKNVFGGYDPSDTRFANTSNASFAAGLTRVDKNGHGSTSLLLSSQVQTPLLNGNEYHSTIVDPDYEERETAQSQTSRESGFVVAIQRRVGNNSFTLSCKEDYKGPNWKFNGNNNEDFLCGASVSHKFNP